MQTLGSDPLDYYIDLTIKIHTTLRMYMHRITSSIFIYIICRYIYIRFIYIYINRCDPVHIHAQSNVDLDRQVDMIVKWIWSQGLNHKIDHKIDHEIWSVKSIRKVDLDVKLTWKWSWSRSGPDPGGGLGPRVDQSGPGSPKWPKSTVFISRIGGHRASNRPKSGTDRLRGPILEVDLGQGSTKVAQDRPSRP